MLGSVPDIHSLRAQPYNTFPDVLTSYPETVGDRQRALGYRLTGHFNVPSSRCADVCAVLNRIMLRYVKFQWESTWEAEAMIGLMDLIG